MVGYSTNSPEWIILDSRTNNLRKAYSVVFLEDIKGVVGGRGDRRSVPERKVPMVYETNDRDNDRGISDKDAHEIGGNEEKENDAQGPVDAQTDDERCQASNYTEEENMNEQAELPLLRSTRVRRQFDPSHMPSGTLEMKKLHDQIKDDSVSSEDETGDPLLHEPVTPADKEVCLAQQEKVSLGLCMAMTTAEELPRSWKQAIHMSHWMEAMEKEIEEHGS